MPQQPLPDPQRRRRDPPSTVHRPVRRATQARRIQRVCRGRRASAGGLGVSPRSHYVQVESRQRARQQPLPDQQRRRPKAAARRRPPPPRQAPASTGEETSNSHPHRPRRTRTRDDIRDYTRPRPIERRPTWFQRTAVNVATFAPCHPSLGAPRRRGVRSPWRRASWYTAAPRHISRKSKSADRTHRDTNATKPIKHRRFRAPTIKPQPAGKSSRRI
jgi:hypothetical protein